MYFPKQLYESIVSEKSGIRFSASHDIEFILHDRRCVQRNSPPQNNYATSIYRLRINVWLTSR